LSRPKDSKAFFISAGSMVPEPSSSNKSKQLFNSSTSSLANVSRADTFLTGYFPPFATVEDPPFFDIFK